MIPLFEEKLLGIRRHFIAYRALGVLGLLTEFEGIASGVYQCRGSGSLQYIELNVFGEIPYRDVRNCNYAP